MATPPLVESCRGSKNAVPNATAGETTVRPRPRIRHDALRGAGYEATLQLTSIGVHWRVSLPVT